LGRNFNIVGRAKDPDSLAEKWRRQGAYRSLEDITDLAGIRIVLYYQSDVRRVRDQLLYQEFEVIEQVIHGASSAETFGYSSEHYLIRLDERRNSLSEYRSFAPLTAEVQVRTVLQDAWAAISHKLDYKSEAEVPISSRRKLFRVAALLETGDDLFDAFRTEIEGLRVEYREKARTDEWRDLTLDLETLRASWEHFPIEAVEAQARSIGFRPYNEDPDPDSLDTDLSQLAGVAVEAGIETVGELAEVAGRLEEDSTRLRNVVELAKIKGFEPWGVMPDVIGFRIALDHPQVIEELERRGVVSTPTGVRDLHGGLACRR
jgi:putative GTP pyrophosphokinase